MGGNFFKRNPDKKAEIVLEEGLDGIVQIKPNEFLTSGWQGLVYHVNPNS